MALANGLRARREAVGLTQAALADAVDVSRQTVIALESGRYQPSLELALKLARHFGIQVESLFWLKDQAS